MLRVTAGVIEARWAQALGSPDGPLKEMLLPGQDWAAGAVLIARRRAERRHGGKWELPGGKVEIGETAEECLARELREELGLEVVVGGHVATSLHNYGNGEIALEAYWCELLGGEVVLVDHDALAWVLPDKLLEFDLAEADVAIARALATRK